MENRWEWLHRLNTTQGLATAIFGGPAVSAFIQAALSAFSRHALPWWENLVVAAVLSGVIFVLMSRGSSRRATAQQARVIWNAPFSSTETETFQIEAAMYGAPHHPPADVTAAVKEMVASGKAVIPVHWKPLLGRDPNDNVLKF